MEECVRRLLTWKGATEEKGLRVNAGKTKIMICDIGLDLLQSSGQLPCAVCHTGVGSNSIFCKGCKHWVHKKCSGLKGLTEDLDYRCTHCQGTAHLLNGRPQREVQVGSDKLEVVASFCYLGDMLSAACGCKLSTTTRVRNAWKKFKELIPVLSSRHLSFKTGGCVYSSCVRRAMLPASETWPLTKPSLQRRQRNDSAMIRQICNVHCCGYCPCTCMLIKNLMMMMKKIQSEISQKNFYHQLNCMKYIGLARKKILPKKLYKIKGAETTHQIWAETAHL